MQATQEGSQRSVSKQLLSPPAQTPSRGRRDHSEQLQFPKMNVSRLISYEAKLLFSDPKEP